MINLFEIVLANLSLWNFKFSPSMRPKKLGLWYVYSWYWWVILLVMNCIRSLLLDWCCFLGLFQVMTWLTLWLCTTSRPTSWPYTIVIYCNSTYVIFLYDGKIYVLTICYKTSITTLYCNKTYVQTHTTTKCALNCHPKTKILFFICKVHAMITYWDVSTYVVC